VGLFFGGTTPGRNGDFAKALYVRNAQNPMPSLLFSIFVERLCDVAAMAVLAFVGLAAFADRLDASSKASIQRVTILVAVIIFAMLPVLLIRRSLQSGDLDCYGLSCRRAGSPASTTSFPAMRCSRYQWAGGSGADHHHMWVCPIDIYPDRFVVYGQWI
jgi:hypothetical protein